MVERTAATARDGGGARRDPIATRQALLAAGALLFSERGYDSVPIEDIAARAGVNKALISYHFGGKHGLYTAVLTSAFRAIAERLQAIEQEGQGARETLHRLLQALAALRRERPDFPTLFVREVLATGIDPAVAPLLVEILSVVRRLAERGAREGVFRRVDPLSLHFGLVGALVFFLATEPARQRAVAERRLPFAMPDFPTFLHYLEDLTLRGLAPGARPVLRKRPAVKAQAPPALAVRRGPALANPASRRKGARA
jgi:AcrR family transcriptional regulator